VGGVQNASLIGFTGVERRLAIFVGGGYVMATPAAIEDKMGGGSLGTVVLPTGWTLLAIM